MWKGKDKGNNKGIVKVKILEEYLQVEEKIEKRIQEFKNLWKNKNHKEIFKEFVFCLLTPQSKATICWERVLNMENKNVLFKGKKEEIKKEIKNIRFYNQKAERIIENRKKFWHKNKFKIIEIIDKIENSQLAREFLVKNVKGYGYKEASHFLRNIGYSFELAILDRHILKNLLKMDVIKEIPKTLSYKKYIEIEKKFIEFSKETKIPMQNLDLFFWYRETGEVFK